MASKAASEKASDEALQVTLWKFCRAMPIGAIERWVGADQGLANARKTVCKRGNQADLITADD